MAVDQEKHKSGPLKQQNKSHKHGRHRTKGELDKSHKGRVDVKNVLKKKKDLDKQQRRHQAKMIRKNKREEVIENKRKLGIDQAPPHVIALVSLSPLCNYDEAINFIVNSDDSITTFTNSSNIKTIVSTRHRQRFTIICPPEGDLYTLLAAAKIADSILFLTPASGEINDFSKKCLTCLLAQGLPSSIHAIQGLKHVPFKKQGDTKKTVHKQLEKWFPEIKLHPIDSESDAALVLRLLSNQKQKHVFYREKRSYLLVDKIEHLNDGEEGDNKGTTKITGFVRGKPLSVNQLLHLPGLGEFQMLQIDMPKDPYPIRKKKENNGMEEDGTCEMDEDVKVVARADPAKQQSLISEAEVDPMEGEQTWPTEEELAEADEAAALLAKEVDEEENKVSKKVPKGMSEYQASWIVDEDEEHEDEDDDDDSEMDSDDDMAESPDDEEEDAPSDQEFDTISMAATTIANDDNYDKDFDMDEEKKEFEKYRLAHENEMFPDEVDTPMDVPARERFQRYRGLKSFRTSPWDPKENLPLDYARIFQFQNFDRTKKRVMKDVNRKIEEDEEDLATIGSYVTIYIDKVPKFFVDNWQPTRPLVVFGLLPHEQKMSVMHFVIRRHPTFDAPVKAKEKIVFHVGYRRFAAGAVFSQHTTGDKFKAERYLPHDGAIVATVYAPIFFPPAPVLLFTEDNQLIATGSVLKSDPNRVVLKKIVISGHPFKIHKKSSVVRYMFFGRDDINWFKPVELFTKYGRRGNIKDPLGMHGHMKCVFDGQLKAQDTVCMNLYKRVYPKWTYDTSVGLPNPVLTEDKTEENTDVNM